MKLKKGLFGYLNFGLGSILLSVYLYTLFVSLCEYIEHKNGLSITIFGINIAFPIAAVIILILILIYILIAYLKGKHVRKDYELLSYIKTLLYWFGMTLLLFYILYRVYTLISGVDSVNRSVVKNLNEEFTLLLSGSVLGTGAVSRFFTSIVVFFFNTFGVSPLVFIILNSFLFFAGTVFFVFSVKIIWGRLPSLFALGFIDLYIQDSSFAFDTTGHNLLYLMASFLIFVISYFFMLFYRKNRVLFFSLFSIIIVGILVLRHFIYSGYLFDFSSALNHYLFYDFNNNVIYLTIAIVTVSLSLFTFFKIFKKTVDDISFITIMLLLTFLFILSTYPDSSSMLFAFAMAGAFAGNGIKALLFEGYKLKSECTDLTVSETAPVEYNYPTVQKETDAEQFTDSQPVPDVTCEPEMLSENEASNETNQIPETETIIENEPLTENETSSEPVKLEIEDIKLTSDVIDTDNVVKPEQTDIPVTKYLFNPLPLPKKHEKKEMNYAFEPKSDEMEYDFEVNDDDDFDLV